MLNFRIIDVAPRGVEAWENYRVSEEEDQKRVAIVHWAQVEGSASVVAILGVFISIFLFVLMDIALISFETFSDWNFGCVMSISLLISALFVVGALVSHKRRVRIIQTLSDEARLQIRSVISFRADADTFMIHEFGISLRGHR